MVALHLSYTLFSPSSSHASSFPTTLAVATPHCSPPHTTPTALLKLFRGHLGELLRHPAGNHVVDDLYAGG